MTHHEYSEMAERLARLLLARGMMVTVAESCTGGGIAQAMTNTPGSSKWFERGFVSYSNNSKKELLGVSEDTLVTFGAVSEQTAGEMATGALDNSHAQISVAVTGIAGPDGGTNEKPVGLVCFGWSIKDEPTKTASMVFQGDRNTIQQQSIRMAIQGLLDLLES